MSEDQSTPGYKTRAMLQEELDAKNAAFADLMARVEALEAKPAVVTSVDAIVEALKQDRETVLSARLQRELDEANRQIEHLQRPQSPTEGIPYSGYVQAKEDCWFPDQGYRRGPKDGEPGEVFQITMPDYWPGCPFTPVEIIGRDPSGRYVVKPHPDFASH